MNWIQIIRLKINIIQKEMNPGCRAQNQLTTNEPTMPYVKAQEINLWTYWAIGESNTEPFEPAASGLTTELQRPHKVAQLGVWI